MGNAHAKGSKQHHGRFAKSVHWSSTERPPPPGKPRLVPGTPHSQPDLVTIRWDPPTRRGGAPVTGYLVEHRRTGSAHWVRSSASPVLRPELTLSGLEPGWRYQFRVSAESDAGRSEPGELSEPLTVTLSRSAAAAPCFLLGLHDTVALENDKVEFVVKFRGTPQPQISWYKDGFEIFSSRRMKVVTEGEQSSLVIFQASFTDEGELKCTATNRMGHVVTRAKLRLEAPPRIRLARQYEEGLLFERDEVIRLKVSVIGRPLPRVTWYHNGESVVWGGRHEVHNTDRGSQLRVAEARRSDRGEYQVRATSRLGEDTASVLVTVTDRPQPPGNATVMSTLGRSVTLSWTQPEDDGGCKIGNYIVEYYRVGWNVWLKAATCRQLTTTLGDLIEGSEYKFRIKAENPYGVSDPSTESGVIFIPDLRRGLLEPPSKSSTNESGTLHKTSSSQQNIILNDKVEQNNRSISLSGVGEYNKHALLIDISGQSKSSESKSLAENKNYKKYESNEAIKNSINKLEFSVTVDNPDFLNENEQPNKLSQSELERPLSIMQYENGEEKMNRELILRRGSSLGPREQDDRMMHGSSELMLLLVPQESEKENGRKKEKRRVSAVFRSESVAPPMSLSAPELGGIDPGAFNQGPLRNAISSTELLHDKANARFFQEAEERTRKLQLEEAEATALRRNHSVQESNLNEMTAFQNEEQNPSEEESEDESVDFSDEDRILKHTPNLRSQTPPRSPRYNSSFEEEDETYHPPRVMIPREVKTISPPPFIPKEPPPINMKIQPKSILKANSDNDKMAEPQEIETVVRRRKKEAILESPPVGREQHAQEIQEGDVTLSAAEIARKRRMQVRQASLEEEAALRSAVSSHYGELISDLSRTRKPRTLYLNTDELKAAVYSQGEESNEKILANDSEAYKVITKLEPYCEQSHIDEEAIYKKESQIYITTSVGEIQDEETFINSEKFSLNNLSDQKTEKKENEKVEIEEMFYSEEPSAIQQKENREINVSETEKQWEQRFKKLREEQEAWQKKRDKEEARLQRLHREIVYGTPSLAPPPEQVQRAVRSWLEYICDLALFLVACWLYLFKDEKLAIPVLLLMIYRQLKEAIHKRIPRMPQLPWRRKQL